MLELRVLVDNVRQRRPALPEPARDGGNLFECLLQKPADSEKNAFIVGSKQNEGKERSIQKWSWNAAMQTQALQ